MAFIPTTTPNSWGLDGRGLLPRDVAAALRIAGAGTCLFQMVATSLGEAGGTKDGVFRVWEGAWNTQTPDNTDRGAFQISTKYHGDVPDADAYDLMTAARHAVRIVGSDCSGLTQWNAWVNVLSDRAREDLRTRAAAGDQAAVKGLARSDDLWGRAILAVANDQTTLRGLPFFKLPS